MEHHSWWNTSQLSCVSSFLGDDGVRVKGTRAYLGGRGVGVEELHGSLRQMEHHSWWNTSQLTCVSSFLFRQEKHPAWNTSQLSDLGRKIGERKVKQSKEGCELR